MVDHDSCKGRPVSPIKPNYALGAHNLAECMHVAPVAEVLPFHGEPESRLATGYLTNSMGVVADMEQIPAKDPQKKRVSTLRLGLLS